MSLPRANEGLAGRAARIAVCADGADTYRTSRSDLAVS